MMYVVGSEAGPGSPLLSEGLLPWGLLSAGGGLGPHIIYEGGLLCRE